VLSGVLKLSSWSSWRRCADSADAEKKARGLDGQAAAVAFVWLGDGGALRQAS